MRRLFAAPLLLAGFCFAQTYTVTTIGGGSPYIGDGGPLADVFLDSPAGVAYGPNGDLFFTDSQLCIVRKADAKGVVTTVAGNTACGAFAEGAPALSTPLPGAGTLYFDVATNGATGPRVGTITVAGKTFSVLQQGTATPAFAVRPGDVISGGSYGPVLSPGSFGSVKPQGFPVSSILTWDNAVPDGVTLPTLLNGVSVKLDGEKSAISYTSPSQVDFLVPSDLEPGNVLLELTANGQTAYGVVKVEPYAPGLYTYPVNGRQNAVAQIAGTTTLVGSATELPGLARPAHEGKYVSIYLGGLGGTASMPPGVVLSRIYPVLDPARVRVWFAGKLCELQFSGAINAGLYLTNAKVPAGVPAGFQQVLVGFDEAGSQAGTGLWFE